MALVLIIEDNDLNLEITRRMLVKAGHEVIFAMDGEEGVDLAYEKRPELILVDMNLPKLDGLGVTKALRRNDKTHATPIIILTANAMEKDRQESEKAGSNDFLTKPLKFETLVNSVERCLQK